MKLKDLFSVLTGCEMIGLFVEGEPRYRIDFLSYCWEKVLNPELLDYEVTEIHTSLRNDSPIRMLLVKAQNSDN